MFVCWRHFGFFIRHQPSHETATKNEGNNRNKELGGENGDDKMKGYHFDLILKKIVCFETGKIHGHTRILTTHHAPLLC